MKEPDQPTRVVVAYRVVKLLIKLFLSVFTAVVLVWGVSSAIGIGVIAVFGPWPDAVFRLAPESRLPRWFTPEALTLSRPTTVMVEMAYYTLPFAPDVVFTLRDSRGAKLAEVEGTRESEPKVRGDSRYPSYKVITVGGITEIIEHRRAEPIFYITDDRAVKERLGVK